MTDWHRMEWQYWANVWSSRALVVLLVLWVPEVFWAFAFHLPRWDEVLGAVTVMLTPICWFIKKHTNMYRIDL